MADAPAAQAALSQVKSDLQRLRDRKQGLQSQVDALTAEILTLVAIRDDYISYIAFKAAQP